jgi:hypothetical protein
VQALKASVHEDGELEPQARWSVTMEYTLMYESTNKQISALGEPEGTNSLESSHPSLLFLPLLVLLVDEAPTTWICNNPGRCLSVVFH